MALSILLLVLKSGNFKNDYNIKVPLCPSSNTPHAAFPIVFYGKSNVYLLHLVHKPPTYNPIETVKIETQGRHRPTGL